MDLFTAGGFYHDEDSRSDSFGILADESEKLLVTDDPNSLYPQIRELGHIYRISDDLSRLSLEMASEAAEQNGIDAPELVDLCARWREALRARINGDRGGR